MLGDISPQTVRITQQAVVYPGLDHVVALRVERFDGRSYKPVDMTDVTRVILSFPETDPVIVYDSQVQAVFTHVGTTLTVDLSDYAMPASALSCQIVLFDAQHTSGQVLVDNIDTEVQFDFRNVSTTGGTPPPAVEYLTDAPIDGATYARKDGVWVPVDALVSGVTSVNSQTGVVVLDAADVGADPAGAGSTAASAAVAAHTALADPHPEYLTPAAADTAYAPAAHVGAGGAAHSNAVAAGAAGFMTGADKTKLDGISANATGLAVVQTFTGAKTLALADINTYNVSQDAAPQAVTLPAQATVSWTADAEIHIERGAAGAVTIVGAVGVQINGAVAGTFTLGAQYSVVTLKRKAPNLWTLFGNAA